MKIREVKRETLAWLRIFDAYVTSALQTRELNKDKCLFRFYFLRLASKILAKCFLMIQLLFYAVADFAGQPTK